MNKTTDSLKWVFLTTIFRRLISFVLFLYIVRVFSREELGVYREFALIISFSSLISTFSFNVLNIVEKSKKYLVHGIQFVVISSVIVSLILFALKGFLATRYNSYDLYLYIFYGFWLILPESLKRLVRSVHELNLNFRFLSIAETINIVAYSLLTIALFLYDLKFYYFITAFYVGNIIELIIIAYPLKKELSVSLIECLKFKYLLPLKKVFFENFAFLSLSVTPTALNMLIAETPILLLGLFYKPEFMGNYFVAAQLVTVPVSFLTISLSQVLFPTFSLCNQSELIAKVSSYLRIVVIILWLPILFFGVLLKNFSHLIIGSQEIAIVNSIIIVLIIKTLFVLIMNPLSSIPTVLRKPQNELYWSVSSISLICIMIYLFRNHEFLQMLNFYITITIISLISFILMIMKMLKIPNKLFMIYVAKGFIYNILLIFVLFFVSSENKLLDTFYALIATGLSISSLYIFEKEFIKQFLRKLFNKTI